MYSIVWHTIMNARMLDDPTPFETFEEAARIYRSCHDDGYVIASPHDCLIAACAILNKVPLLQRDRDFEKIADMAPLEMLKNV
jgi:predicted nucleic acid-binding protein